MNTLTKALTLLFAISLVGCASNSNRNPRAADANARLAITYLESGDVPLAKEAAMNAVKEAPKSAFSWYTMAYFEEATGRPIEAEKDYKHAIKLEPNNGIPYNDYGTFLCRAGRYQESIKQFLLATKQPSYLQVADAYENAGLCSLLIPNQEAAMNYFKLAITNSPSHETSLLELSKLYLAKGNLVQAKQYFKRYESLSPQPSKAAKKVAAQLQQLAKAPQKRQELPEPQNTLTR